MTAPLPSQIRKLHRLSELAREDAQDPIVVNQASLLARPYRPDDWSGIANEVHRWVRDGIRFQRDPDRVEEFAPSSTVLRRRWDDCDGKSKLAVALLRSLGMDADIQPVWDSDGYLAHVQYKVRWPGSQSYPGSKHGWVVGETTIDTAELGQDPHSVPLNHDTGRLPLSGGPRR